MCIGPFDKKQEKKRKGGKRRERRKRKDGRNKERRGRFKVLPSGGGSADQLSNNLS